MPGLLSIDEALRRVLARVAPLDSERVPAAGAAGRVLAADAVAVVDLPPFRSSAMDGYALRAEDAPGRLPIVFRIAAGKPAETALEPGEAMAISTGGAVPEGADSVVPIELRCRNRQQTGSLEPRRRGREREAGRRRHPQG